MSFEYWCQQQEERIRKELRESWDDYERRLLSVQEPCGVPTGRGGPDLGWLVASSNPGAVRAFR